MSHSTNQASSPHIIEVKAGQRNVTIEGKHAYVQAIGQLLDGELTNFADNMKGFPAPLFGVYTDNGKIQMQNTIVHIIAHTPQKTVLSYNPDTSDKERAITFTNN